MGVQVGKQEGEEWELVDCAVLLAHAHQARRVPEGPFAAATAGLLAGIARQLLAIGRQRRVGFCRAGQEPQRLRDRAKQHHKRRRRQAGCR